MMNIEHWLLSYLVNSLWQIPLVFGVAWLAARNLQAYGPEVEHRVWVGALLLEVTLPACSLLPAEWLPTAWQSILGRWTAGSFGGGSVTVATGPGVAGGRMHFAPWLPDAAVILYLISVAFFAARFCWRGARLRALRRDARRFELAEDLRARWDRCMHHFGVSQMALAFSSRVTGPVTLGHRRRLLLLPGSMGRALAPDDFEAILAHEFAHVRRNDFGKNLLYELLSLSLSYHPLFWLTRERIVESREMVCDQMAAEFTGRTHYGHSLLRLASLIVAGKPARTPHAIGIFDANAFERRIMKLTLTPLSLSLIRRIGITLACTGLAVSACGTALALRVSVPVLAPATGQEQSATPHFLVKIAGGVIAGNILTRVPPVYPQAAKDARIQGVVVLHAVIGKGRHHSAAPGTFRTG